jgi:hypothetical protein
MDCFTYPMSRTLYSPPVVVQSGGWPAPSAFRCLGSGAKYKGVLLP